MKLLSIAIIFIAANTIMARAGAQETYKCGNSYSQTPCPGGQADCVDAEKHPLPSTCTSTPHGPFCLDPAYPPAQGGAGGGGAGGSGGAGGGI